jgi:hypothetical protein
MAKDEPLDEKLDEERDEDGQIYVDRDKIDFDPEDGLLSGTAIDGTSDSPGPDGEGDGEGDTDGEHDKDS